MEFYSLNIYVGSTLATQNTQNKQTKKSDILALCGLVGTYRVLENVLPLSKSTHRLLDADDLVSNGLVPFDLQLHVMVVLTRDKQRQSRNIFIKDGLPKFMLT